MAVSITMEIEGKDAVVIHVKSKITHFISYTGATVPSYIDGMMTDLLPTSGNTSQLRAISYTGDKLVAKSNNKIGNTPMLFSVSEDRPFNYILLGIATDAGIPTVSVVGTFTTYAYIDLLTAAKGYDWYYYLREISISVG